MKTPLIVRRVEGHSMWPTLSQDDIVAATPLIKLRPGAVVIARVNGREYIKRVESIEYDKVRLLGDNYYHSHDSRQFGLLRRTQIIGTVIGYPRSFAGVIRTMGKLA
ncbi:MAG TPA: S26 family signal peptidase [Candidatus Saccharimonadales bacterium]